MKKIYCDICGNKVPTCIEFNHDKLNVEVFKNDKQQDICEDCRRQLIKYVSRRIIKSDKEEIDDEKSSDIWQFTGGFSEYYGTVYRCPKCKSEVFACDAKNFCTYCGTRLKWE